MTKRAWVNLIIGLVFALAVPIQAQMNTRMLKGRVLSADHEPLKGAVVQLKNTRTLVIRSFISQADGGYHFAGLNPDIDYEVHARYWNGASARKTVSHFDSRPVAEIDLIIDDGHKQA